MWGGRVVPFQLPWGTESGLGILGPKRKCFALEVCVWGTSVCRREECPAPHPLLCGHLPSVGLSLKLILTVLHVLFAVCTQENIYPGCPRVSVRICEHVGSVQN